MSASEVRRMAVVSTGHLPPRYAKDGPGVEPGVVAYALSDVGWLVWVPDDPRESSEATEDQVPKVLLDVQLWARAQGVDYVLFDRDGPDEPELRRWSWW